MAKVKWDLFRMTREWTLNELVDVSEEEANRVPNGFHNNIRWNIGHIHYVSANMFEKFTGESNLIPEGYQTWFAPGTKPADWQDVVPSIEILQKGLKNQVEQLERLFAERLGEKLTEPRDLGTVQLTTIGELLDFVIFHEGIHNGGIRGLKRAMGK